jgi:mono/diheme cytochrome c family protein
MHRTFCLLGLTAIFGLAPVSIATSDDAIQYNRDVRGILADNCFACHGPDSAARKADLRLDKREAAVEMGAITPGQPDESELIARITSDDPELRMPPATTHKTVTPEQVDLLKRWIAAGAEYQPHWSFIPPVRPPVPQVTDAAWPRTPIDNFILSKLEAAGLAPAPEADRRTLARRASLDLTGLPPEPAVVEAFVNDTSPDAYEKYVDYLLSLPAWGEHRGRYWLDVARYADTHGIHFDNFREMWSYREWVIEAFNRNIPFSQFTIEQLAGDLLPDRTLDQVIASGFNRCNMTTNEGGVIPEEYLVLYARDRTETTSQVWLGLTAGCAVCHDHKFDPLTQREFYELAAFFNNTTQGAMDGNIKDTPPVVMVPPDDLRSEWDQLKVQVAEAAQQVDARRASGRADFDGWLAASPVGVIETKVTNAGLCFHAPLNDNAGNVLTFSVDGQSRAVTVPGSPQWDEGVTATKALKTQAETIVEVSDAGNFEKDQAFTCSVRVKVPKKGLTGAILSRMDDANGYRGWDVWLNDGKPASHVIHQWPDDAVKVIGKTELEPNRWYTITLTYEAGGNADSVKLYLDGQRQEVDVAANSLKNSIRTEVPLKLAQRNTGSRLNDIVLQDLRIYDRALPASEIVDLNSAARMAFLVAKPPEGRTPSEVDELFGWWLKTIDDTFRQLTERKGQLEAREGEIKNQSTIAHVMQEKSEEAMAFILFRGEYDKRRDPVKADTPDIMPAFPADLPKNRLGLAQWLLREDHPLTARVTVNRFWQEVFGAGLVKTAGDLGVAGQLPTHPELLDWMAIEFREQGWDIKKFFKMLVMSSTYRQSAVVTPEKLEQDVANRLLSRGPRFRMDAEMVRDSALASSGLLVPTLGGPSVRPYQPPGVWEAVAMIGSNTRDYKEDTGASLYRRSLYTFWKRAAPPASMDIFNAPNREVCTVQRERTNTPLQALVTLNDPQFVEAARRLAERALREGGDNDAARIDFIARRILARSFTEREGAVVADSLAKLLAFYGAHAEEAKQLIETGESQPDASLDPANLAGWTMLANELMNLDEVLTK